MIRPNQLAEVDGKKPYADIRVRKEAFCELGFFLLEAVDAFLDGFLAEELVDEDGLVLADAVGAIRRLRLGSGIPPWIIVDDGICCC